MVEICSVIAIVLWLVRVTVQRRFAIEIDRPTAVALGGFILFNVASCFWSIEPLSSGKAVFSKLFQNVLLFMICLDVFRTPKQFRNIISLLFFSVGLIALDGLYQKFTGVDLLRRQPLVGGPRFVSASFKNPNNLAGWIMLVFYPVLIILFDKKYFRFTAVRKAVCAAFLILLFICLMLTDARAAWISFFCGACIFSTILVTCFQSKNRLLSFILILCVVGLIWTSTPLFFKERVFSLFDPQTNAERIKLWHKALIIIKEFNFVGSGINTFAQATRQVSFAGTGYAYPHNFMLHMAAEIGIPGLVSFLIFLGIYFKKSVTAVCRHHDPLLAGFFTSIAVFLLHSFFDTNIYSLQLTVLFWIFLGLSSARMKYLSHRSD